MLSSSPLAAQTDPSATRSFEAASVEPDGTVTVHIDIEGVAVAGSVTETVPAGFIYLSTTGLPLNDTASDLSAGVLVFPFLGNNDFSYVLTAPSGETSYTFSGSLNPGPSAQSVDVGGATVVTVSTDPTTPPADQALAIPDLDDLNPETQDIFSAGMAGNSVAYTAASGTDDAKVVARVSPGAEAIITIDLGMEAFPDTQQVNFSLTDGANLDFQIKKTGDDTAEIVVKDGVTLTAGQNNFQLVVNEFGNAPANTEDVDVVVHVVIDNESPEFTDPPASGTVAEARDER